MPIRDRPLFTETFDDPHIFKPEQGSVYVFGTGLEQRSEHLQSWRSNAEDVRFAAVTEERPTYTVIDVGGESLQIALRSARQLAELWKRVACEKVYLDITGIRHHVWAPMVRSALYAGKNLMVVYVEPLKYRPSLVPTEGDIYDLSERITGIAPIPGFTMLADPGEKLCFVPLLGFEGTRVSYLLEQVQPPGGKTVPVIGVPGFMPDHSFAAYLGNRIPLSETEAWKNVRFSRANCPFSLFYTLQDITKDYPGHTLTIAPIGTKPHALGAVMFAIVNQSAVELVYDHPIRKAKRTEGLARLLVYHVSAFVA